jgi:hypothetical protein
MPDLTTNKVILHQDDVHLYTHAMAKINLLSYEVLPHPSYSSDMVR